MAIAEIKAFPLRIPFRSASRSDAAVWGGKGLPAVDSLLVRVTDGDGVVGWGEGFGFAAVGAAKLLLETLIEPLCAGRDAGDIAAFMLWLRKKVHIYGLSGPLVYALSAIDTALWDIAGKRAGKPVHSLLADSPAGSLRCYASLARFTEPALVRAAVERAVASGFRAIKLHEIDIAAIEAAREAAGPGTDLMLDVNCPWSLSEATAMSRRLEAVRPLWLEEPIWPPDDYDSLRRLREATRVPVAAGENTTTLADFERLLSAGAVDIVQPSPAKMGGITELARIFPLAAAHGAEVAVHSFYDGPGLLAAVHASAALGGADQMVERRYFDLEADIYGGRLAPSACIEVPSAPGLGIEPDPGVLERFRPG